jgi:hypothetical protein
MFEFVPRRVVQLFAFAVIAYSGFLIALAMVVSFMWVASSNNNNNNNNNNIPNSSANNRRRGSRQRKTQHEQGDSQQKRIFFSFLILLMSSKINPNINGKVFCEIFRLLLLSMNRLLLLVFDKNFLRNATNGLYRKSQYTGLIEENFFRKSPTLEQCSGRIRQV